MTNQRPLRQPIYVGHNDRDGMTVEKLLMKRNGIRDVKCALCQDRKTSLSTTSRTLGGNKVRGLITNKSQAFNGRLNNS